MRVHANANVTITFEMTLTEDEANALERIAGYSANAVLAGIAQTCGESIVREHGKGLSAFFGSFGAQVSPALSAVRDARKTLRDAEKNRLENLRKDAAA